MNSRSYRVNIIYSPMDFRVNIITESSIEYQSEPFLHNNKMLLTITKRLVVHNIDNIKKHQVLSVQSDYEIPSNEIMSKEDVYDFYKDALLGLDEVYKAYQTEMPSLPDWSFTNQPIENYQGEIERVFELLSRRN